jgi:hypothetical protein
MRKLLIVALFAFIASTASAELFIPPVWRDLDGSNRKNGYSYPLPTQNMPVNAFNGSQSFVIGTSAVLIPTLQTGTRAIMVGATGGAINYGAANVPTGSSPFKISDDTYVEFSVTTTTPVLYLRAQVASVTVKILEK